MDKNINFEELTTQKKFPDDYNIDTIYTIEGLSLTQELENIKIFGSFAYRLPYTSDIDLLEEFNVHGNRNFAIKRLDEEIKYLVKDAHTFKHDILMEFKLGTDSRFDIDIGYLDRGIYYPNRSLIQISKAMMDEKLLLADEVQFITNILNDPKYQLRGYYTPEAFDVINDIFREQHIIRWSYEELKKNSKKLRAGKVINIKQSISTLGHIKTDVIAYINNNLTEVSNFIFLISENKGVKYIVNYDKVMGPDFIATETENGLTEEIEKLFYSKFHYSPYKGIKRLFALARSRNDFGVLKRLVPILTSSIALMYQLKAQLNAIKYLFVSNIKISKLVHNAIYTILNELKNKIPTILILSKDEIDNIIREINVMINFKEQLSREGDIDVGVDLIREVNLDERINLLDNIITIFETKLKNNAIAYLKEVQLFPIPCNYLPNKLKYLDSCHSYYEQVYDNEYEGSESTTDYDTDSINSDMYDSSDFEDELIKKKEAAPILGIEDELSGEDEKDIVTRPVNLPVPNPVVPIPPLPHPDLIDLRPNIPTDEPEPINIPGPTSEDLPLNPPDGRNWLEYGAWILGALGAAALAYGAYRNRDQIYDVAQQGYQNVFGREEEQPDYLDYNYNKKADILKSDQKSNLDRRAMMEPYLDLAENEGIDFTKRTTKTLLDTSLGKEGRELVQPYINPYIKDTIKSLRKNVAPKVTQKDYENINSRIADQKDFSEKFKKQEKLMELAQRGMTKLGRPESFIDIGMKQGHDTFIISPNSMAVNSREGPIEFEFIDNPEQLSNYLEEEGFDKNRYYDLVGRPAPIMAEEQFNLDEMQELNYLRHKNKLDKIAEQKNQNIPEFIRDIPIVDVFEQEQERQMDNFMTQQDVIHGQYDDFDVIKNRFEKFTGKIASQEQEIGDATEQEVNAYLGIEPQAPAPFEYNEVEEDRKRYRYGPLMQNFRQMNEYQNEIDEMNRQQDMNFEYHNNRPPTESMQHFQDQDFQFPLEQMQHFQDQGYQAPLEQMQHFQDQDFQFPLEQMQHFQDQGYQEPLETMRKHNNFAFKRPPKNYEKPILTHMPESDRNKRLEERQQRITKKRTPLRRPPETMRNLNQAIYRPPLEQMERDNAYDYQLPLEQMGRSHAKLYKAPKKTKLIPPPVKQQPKKSKFVRATGSYKFPAFKSIGRDDTYDELKRIRDEVRIKPIKDNTYTEGAVGKSNVSKTENNYNMYMWQHPEVLPLDKEPKFNKWEAYMQQLSNESSRALQQSNQLIESNAPQNEIDQAEKEYREASAIYSSLRRQKYPPDFSPYRDPNYYLQHMSIPAQEIVDAHNLRSRNITNYKGPSQQRPDFRNVMSRIVRDVPVPTKKNPPPKKGKKNGPAKKGKRRPPRKD